MTVRVSTLSGASSAGLTAYYMGLGDNRGSLLHEPATNGLTSYYAATPGEWHGAGAQQLGLTGPVTAQQFKAMLDGGTPEGLLLGQRFNDKSARAFDVTFSVPKDISVLWALADSETRSMIETSFNSSVDAVLNGVEQRALSRYRLNGVVTPIATTGLTIAKVFEHTSRAGDPALHCHAIISSKVECVDGTWRALDARELKWGQQGLSAQFHRALEAELTRTLGVKWGQRTQWAAAPLHAIPDGLCELFSTRTVDVDTDLEVRLSRFETGMGRAPTPQERHRLQREAVLATRPNKHAATALLEHSHSSSFHDMWRDQARNAGYDISQILPAVTRIAAPIPTMHIDFDAAVTQALENVTVGRSSWRTDELARELARAIPSGIDLTPTQIVAWSWQQAEHICEHAVTLNHDPTPHCRRYSTQPILDQEQHIIDFADTQGGQAQPCPTHPDTPLNLCQQAAAERLAGTEPLIIIEGPAGTGKTTALTTGVRQLRVDGRQVFGVAPSAQAAAILSNETGIATDSLAKLLWEHTVRDTGPDPRYDLPTRTTIIVDEAGMASTPDLAALTQLAEQYQWRLVLVGDPMQLSAVGRGGMLQYLIDSHPELVTTLHTVHRFNNEWEQHASLRLRQGDPGILEEYNHHRRLRISEEPLLEAVERWADQRRHGTVALIAADNDTVHALNTLAQRLRGIDGELGDTSTPGRDDCRLHVGDTVVTRHNNRFYGVKNRETWTITSIGTNQIQLVNPGGATSLPTDWVAQHVELGYATTAHGIQGATVDYSIAVHVEGHELNRESLYIAMSRARNINMIVTDHRDPVASLSQAMRHSWGDQPAHTHQLDNTPALQPPTPQRVASIDETPEPTQAEVPDVQVRSGPHVLLVELDQARQALTEASSHQAAAARTQRRTGDSVRARQGEAAQLRTQTVALQQQISRVGEKLETLRRNPLLQLKNRRDIAELETQLDTATTRLIGLEDRHKGLVASIDADGPAFRDAVAVSARADAHQAAAVHRVEHAEHAVLQHLTQPTRQQASPPLHSVLTSEEVRGLYETRIQTTETISGLDDTRHRTRTVLNKAHHDVDAARDVYTAAQHALASIDQQLDTLGRNPLQQMKNRRELGVLTEKRPAHEDAVSRAASGLGRAAQRLKRAEQRGERSHAEVETKMRAASDTIKGIDGALSGDVIARVDNIKSVLRVDPDHAQQLPAPTIKTLDKWIEAAARTGQYKTGFDTPEREKTPAARLASKQLDTSVAEVTPQRTRDRGRDFGISL